MSGINVTIVLRVLKLLEDETAWFSWTLEELLLRGIMYWVE